MNAEEKNNLALFLLSQGLADLDAARALLETDYNSKILGREVDFSHVAISKVQQSSEKILKGYFLFHGESINPLAGHNPMTKVCDNEAGGKTKFMNKFREVVKNGNKLHVGIIKLEGLAPTPPSGTKDLSLVKITDFDINTEYPFFDNEANGINFPAGYYFDRKLQVIQCINHVLNLCRVLNQSAEESIYEMKIKEYLDENKW